MPYPKEFYSSPTQSGKAYQRHPSGKPDVERLIQNRDDYWLNLAPIRKEKKKKLILADWSAIAWSEEKIADTLLALEQLMNDGFELFLWQSGQLKPLSKEQLLLLKESTIRKALMPDTLEKIHLAAATQLHLAQDEIHVLDDYWINHLLSKEDTLKPRTLSVRDFSEVPDEQSDTLIHLLKQSKPEIQYVVQDEFSRSANTTWVYLCKSFPKERMLPAKYRRVILSYNENTSSALSGITLRLDGMEKTQEIKSEMSKITITELITLLTSAPKIQKLYLSNSLHLKIPGDFIFTAGSLPYLGSVHTGDLELSALTVNSLLTAAPRLKKLDLSGTKIITGDLTPLPGSLPELEAVNLACTNVSSASIQALLAATSQLKELYLTGCRNINDEITLSPGKTFGFKKIMFESSNISSSSIQAFLSAVPQLQELNLENCQNITGDITLTSGSLPELKKVNLSESKISSASLVMLLAAAPRIKTLNLTKCENISANFILTQGSLPELEELDLNGSKITSANLKSLLAAATGLKKLTLYDCQKIAADLTLDPGSLPELEELDLRASNISFASLQNLLLAAPKLKKLSVPGNSNISGEPPLSPGSLPQLEEIDSSYNNIPITGLQSLLTAASRLKKLNLNYYKNNSANINLIPASLPQLKELCLSYNNITSASLHSLFLAAPGLTTLILTDCGNLSPDIISPDSLTNLEIIDLSRSNISTDCLKRLLVAAPQLKILQLNSCKDIYGDLALPPESLAHLEMINLNDSLISAVGLESILAAAPALRELKLNECGLGWWYAHHLPKSMPNLERISLDRSDISAGSIQALLSVTPKLKTLRLFGVIDLSDTITLKPGSLPYLEALDLRESKITSANLQQLLLAAPQLKNIELSSCWTIKDDLTLPQGSLPYLEELDLAAAQITSFSLQNLLVAAPRLKTLNLNSCTNVYDPIILDSGSLPHLEKLELYRSNIPIEIVNDLLAAAPRLNKEEILLQDRTPYSYAYVGGPGIGGAGTSSHKERPTGPSKTSEARDANTSVDTTPTFFLNRFFYPLGHDQVPPVSNYRLNIFQIAETPKSKCTVDEAFSIRKAGDLDLQPCPIPKLPVGASAGAGSSSEGKMYYGKQKLALQANQWQPLASLSAHEKMQRYNTTPDADIVIKYSTRDNLYYVLSKTEQTIEIDFDVIVPDEPALPEDIKEKVEFFCSFTPGALTFDKDPASFTGEDYLDAIIKQKKGACRHRAIAFKAMMAKERSDLPVRIITNDCHEFVEVKIRDTWIRCDLGGYPGKLEINESNNPNRSAGDPLVTRSVINETKHKSTVDFDRALQTWDKKTSLTTTPLEYYEKCVALRVKKRLIECPTAHDADALHYALQAHCQHISRPVFYVNSPDDLICSAPYMHRNEDNTGDIRRGPSGPLHTFLTTHLNGVVIVNYGAFKADDLVRFNTLLDIERKADGTNVPKDTVIIGLLNLDNPNPLPGSDFYSRFDEVDSCPLNSSQLASAMPNLPSVPASSSVGPVIARHEAIQSSELRSLGCFVPRNDGFIVSPSAELVIPSLINLYNSSDWEGRLLGHWVPDKGSWHFEPGELQRALATGAKTIEIQNGLWENKDFCRFWREAQQLGFINHAGGTIDVTKITFVRTEGYRWPALTPFFQEEKRLSDSAHTVLNCATFGNFFSQYQVTRDKHLQRVDGLIQAASSKEHKELRVHVTSSLSDDQWARLMEECATYKVMLKVFCAEGIKLPEVFHIEASVTPKPKPWVGTEARPTALIQSTDVDTTVAELVHSHPDSLVIDVSECRDSDLLLKTNGVFINKKREALRLEFSETQCAVARALEKGQSVILKGRCKAALADELTPFLLARQKETTALGQLMIVSGDTSVFHGMPQYAHAVTVEEKQTALRRLVKAIPDELKDHVAKEQLSILLARCRLMQRKKGVSNEEGWAGLRTLPAGIKDSGAFDADSSEEAAKQFTKDRLKGINTILADEPYVFLTGLSGVGKTMFVAHDLCGKSDTLYSGETALLDWAKDTTSGKRKLLFLDEANLSTSEWSAFEGLFNTPPGILIDGEYHLLTAEHKVIFAGNPISYGAERKLAPFFARHGNALVFEPLPSSVLYERVLKPVLKDTLLESKTKEISTHLLAVYRFLCLSSETDMLISPRELQMMALLAVSYCSRQETPQDVEAVAKYFAYHLGKSLVPKDKKEEFDRLFQPKFTLPAVKEITGAEFLITPSRQHVSQLLEEFLALREIRHEADENLAQRYGGLGGIILDGEPGIGKSEMVMVALRARGYEEMHDITLPPTSDKPFYHMPVSMPLAEKEKLLRKAFNEGAVVVIDEINSSPMMEQLLNALLMGTTPEGTRPEQPGFMVIGTQNPISMAGRRALSTALARRMTTIELPPYTSDEMRSILQAKGLDKDLAIRLVEAYQTQVSYAKEHHLQPSPTFRDLLRLEKQIERGYKRTEVIGAEKRPTIGECDISAIPRI